MTPERHARLGAVLDRRQPDLTVLMDNVHKPHNLAAVARSCDAVGVGVVHGVGEDAEIRLRQKSASGSAGWLEVVMHEGLDAALAAVRAQGMRVVAAHWSDRAVGFRDYDYTRPTALLLGAELDGVSAHAAEVADAHVTIPMLGMVRSLNVSVAAALILFEAQRQREAAGLYARPRLPADERARLLFEYGYPRIAAHCRRRGLAYPPLGPEGEIADPAALSAALRGG